MPAHSRSKNGVASLAYVAGIRVFFLAIGKQVVDGRNKSGHDEVLMRAACSPFVIAGLDPAIHAEPHFSMDHRVKPGGDEKRSAGAYPQFQAKRQRPSPPPSPRPRGEGEGFPHAWRAGARVAPQ
jgi:hypothetical protein